MLDDYNLGGNLMCKLNKLAQNKLAIGVISALFFGALIGAPLQSTSAETNADFGVNTINNTTKLGSAGLVETVTQIINVALGLLGIIAVVIILWGGFKWMTAGGNEENVEEARKIIFQGIIGLAIILGAWSITQFVIGSLSEATGTGDVSPQS
ncbi:MAG: pilin [Candidatus Magasanikbacteria bacterium]